MLSCAGIGFSGCGPLNFSVTQVQVFRLDFWLDLTFDWFGLLLDNIEFSIFYVDCRPCLCHYRCWAETYPWKQSPLYRVRDKQRLTTVAKCLTKYFQREITIRCAVRLIFDVKSGGSGVKTNFTQFSCCYLYNNSRLDDSLRQQTPETTRRGSKTPTNTNCIIKLIETCYFAVSKPPNIIIAKVNPN